MKPPVVSTPIVCPEAVAAQPLVRHPASPQVPALSLHAWVWPSTKSPVTGWCFHYELVGDVAAVRFPAPQAPTQADGLWHHTCFEAFVGLRGDAAYREFNFSPSGQWAHYSFSDQRQRDPQTETALQAFAPTIACRSADNTFFLQAWVPAAAWPTARPGESLELGLSAVIETLDGAVSHWALHHPRPQPDFHHRGAFVAQV